MTKKIDSLKNNPQDNCEGFLKSFMYMMHKTYMSINRHMEQLFKNEKVTFSQFIILATISHFEYKDFVSQSDVASFMDTTEANISRHITTLKKNGLITSKTVIKNKRINSLFLTESGNQTLLKAKMLLDKKLNKVFKVLSESEKDISLNVFKSLLSELEKQKTN